MRTRFQIPVSGLTVRSYLAGLIVTAAVLVATSCGGSKGNLGVPNTLTIALAGSGHGTVTSSPGGISCTNANATGSPIGTCDTQLDDNTQVSLTATAETGSAFTGWSGGDVACGSASPCSLTVSDTRTITATFESASATQTLTVVGGGSGSGRVVSDPAGIDCTISGGTAAGTGCANSFASGTTVELQVQDGTLVGWGGACSGASCSVVMDQARTVIGNFAADAPATQLAFVGQPSAVQVGNVIKPAVQVAVQDAAGQTVGSRSDAITLSIAANPGSATLGGTVTRNAENGVATFSDLTLNQVGNNYTLTAAAAGLTNATSVPFNVSPEPVAQLAFSVQPSTAQAGTPLTPAVKVEIRDALGVLLSDRTDQIAISLQNNPGAATLGGTKTATAVAGVATFTNLTVPTVATGYTLSATTANASGATSSAFDITPGSPKQLVVNDGQGQTAPVGTNVPVRPSVKVLDAFNNVVPGVNVKWEVTAGGGSVVASTDDPVNRPTGPLGLSTAVSWTLGPDVGNNNNELRATATGTGIAGNPITFTASGTVPPDKGVFKGVLKRIANTGFVTPPVPIAGASLAFVNLTNGAPAGTASTKTDGSFTSPPLPGGNQYRIDVTATNFKAISYAKPGLDAGATASLGDLGMVPASDAQGTAAIGFEVKLGDVATGTVRVHASTATIHVDVFRGYFVGEPDERFIANSDDQETDDTGIANFGFDPLGDWGLLTVRVSAPGYVTQDLLIVVDDPLGQRGPCDDNGNPKGCISPFVLQPAPVM